jgi:hypothetical protein
MELKEPALNRCPEVATVWRDLHRGSGARHRQEMVVRRDLSCRGPRHEAEHPEIDKTMRILRIVEHPFRRGSIGGTPARATVLSPYDRLRYSIEGARDSSNTASASISTSHRGSMKPVTTIIALAGRTSENTSP